MVPRLGEKAKRTGRTKIEGCMQWRDLRAALRILANWRLELENEETNEDEKASSLEGCHKVRNALGHLASEGSRPLPTRRAHGSEWRDRRRESAEAGSSNRGIHPRRTREDAAISPVSERARVQAADRQAGAHQGSPRMGGQSCRHETSAQGRAPDGRARLQAATCSQRVQLRVGAQSVDQPWHTDKSFLDRLAADVLQASGAEGERAETCGERQDTGVDVRGAPCRLQTTGTKHGVVNRAVQDAGRRARRAGKQRHQAARWRTGAITTTPERCDSSAARVPVARVAGLPQSSSRVAKPGGEQGEANGRRRWPPQLDAIMRTVTDARIRRARAATGDCAEGKRPSRAPRQGRRPLCA